MAEKRLKVTIVGGGSYNWSPGLLKDMAYKKEIQNIDFYLLDINLAAAKDIAAYGGFLNKHFNRTDRYIPTTNRIEAISGSSQIVITITKGGLDAMENDLLFTSSSFLGCVASIIEINVSKQSSTIFRAPLSSSAPRPSIVSTIGLPVAK